MEIQGFEVKFDILNIKHRKILENCDLYLRKPVFSEKDVEALKDFLFPNSRKRHHR